MSLEGHDMATLKGGRMSMSVSNRLATNFVGIAVFVFALYLRVAKTMPKSSVFYAESGF